MAKLQAISQNDILFDKKGGEKLQLSAKKQSRLHFLEVIKFDIEKQ